MERCIDCNSLLMKKETVCSECGCVVKTNKRGDPVGMVTNVVSVFFYLSLAAIPASFFIENGPKLSICVLVSAALSFLLRTMRDRDPVTRR